MTRQPRTLVLVHGAWHGSWCWQRVIPLLEARGIAVRTVDLPSTSANVSAGADLSADAAAVRRVIDATASEVVVCGHSYGGMVISHPSVGTHPRVASLVYLCAFMPDAGQSLYGIRGGTPAPWIRTDERGMTLPDLNLAASVFYGDCDAVTQQWAIRQLRKQPDTCFTEPVATPSWQAIPSTYVVCELDAGIPADLQRSAFASKARVVRALNASHSPFLSQPAALADLLAAG